MSSRYLAAAGLAVALLVVLGLLGSRCLARHELDHAPAVHELVHERAELADREEVRARTATVEHAAERRKVYRWQRVTRPDGTRIERGAVERIEAAGERSTVRVEAAERAELARSERIAVHDEHPASPAVTHWRGALRAEWGTSSLALRPTVRAELGRRLWGPFWLDGSIAPPVVNTAPVDLRASLTVQGEW